MKITVEIPDSLVCRARLAAANRRIPLPQLVIEALTNELRQPAHTGKGWMKSFGRLRDLGSETARIISIIESEFKRV